MQDDQSIGFQRTRKERVYWVKINEDTVEEIDGLTLTLATLFRMFELATITCQFINYQRGSSSWLLERNKWEEVYLSRMEITIFKSWFVENENMIYREIYFMEFVTSRSLTVLCNGSRLLMNRRYQYVINWLFYMNACFRNWIWKVK